MTTPDPNEQGSTRPIELPGAEPSSLLATPSPPPAPAPPDHVAPLEPEIARPRDPEPLERTAPIAPLSAPPTLRSVSADHPDVTYVPLAVSIGDGFKFGCGFFLAMVIAALVAFVLLAALFVLTGLFGLSIPFGR